MKDLIPVRAEGSHFLESKCYNNNDSDNNNNNELLIPYPSHIPL